MAIDIIGGGGKNKSGGTLYMLLNIAIIVVVVIVVVKIYKSLKAGSAAIGEGLGNQGISIQTGVPAARVGILRTLALEANAPVYRWWFTNTIMKVDEAPFVNTLNRVISPQEAALMSQFFRENTGDSLKTILESSHIGNQYKIMVTYRSAFA